MDRNTSTRETLARQSLRWDAGYCMTMGAALAVFFAPIATAVEAPKPLIAIGGVATVVWGGLIARMSLGSPWRRITTLVAAVNLAATAALAVVAVVTDIQPVARVLLLGVALQVFAFAAIQAHALWSPLVR